MSQTVDALIHEYFASGTLAYLPDSHFIDGAWRTSASGETMEVFDPGLGKAFTQVAAGDAEDVDAAVEAADAALRGPWRRMLPADRSRILLRAAEAIRSNAQRLAVIETLDNGKTLAEAQSDVRNTARIFEYYAGIADKLQGETIPLGADHFSCTQLEPVGVTAHIIPWNYPISTAARSLAPALAAGCTAVLKPSELTPLSALLLAGLLQQAGLPPGVCNVVNGTGAKVGAALTQHPKVRHVTFTGSVNTGIHVMQAAARNIASVTLELGGKSPAIVLADADLDAALEDVLWAIYSNAGQICSAGSRLIIERSVHQQFVERLAARARQLSLGHGLRNPDIGAITTVDQLQKIEAFVEGARARGVHIAAGGRRSCDPATDAGWFFQPTLLDNLATSDPLVQEEVFGPVLSVQVADNAEHALELANATPFGLAAGIYTRDFSRAMRLARDLDAGQIYINEYFAGGVETPFGGNKRSGFGREKGLEGLRAYYAVKTITARI
ncbi:acyl-CoA reductase-like NAD-dependent aldehyde dehydrogenase [Pseudomonas nitritireducens]|uniref:Acyl-CoA reductase-like NAD-dependent aldehyde dehydrogenase n=1 Tax=Pseudomonas nitroreducens TaxID=46680 RepID=A0A7W7KN11_PSENT|nr:aldehyde dehydrogenase family protein [Pseudomonas nitritireducens]MBB4865829.1 acyl-CoA reductase-like NAD-dependent aldehyde dehydrogenase [Pseudomonas nitritireducens]